MRHVIRLFALGAALSSLSACILLQSTETVHYLFEPVGELETAADVAYPGTLAVTDVEVSEVFDRRQIVQRVNGPEVRYLTNDLWAGSPGTGIARLAMLRIDEAGLFDVVRPESRDLDAEYELAGSVDRLEFDVSTNRPTARLGGRFVVRRRTDGPPSARDRFPATVEFNRSRELEQDSSLAFARAVNAMLTEEVDRLIELLRRETDE